ncbi:MAG: YgiQ family radical SAM protein [Spirochaetes bacterium]|nr:YgiQ family radical SAM protein [Spirochaetota bacterium]
MHLPLTKDEALKRGWKTVDIVLVTGDAYVDHPSFGVAVIGRVLEKAGFRVGIIAMPDFTNPSSIEIFGRPNLFFGVTSGNIDSMLSRFTAFKKIRNDDPYVPGGRGGVKPSNAVITYCNLIKQRFKDIPIVIGGIEASMRRLVHYDFIQDKLRRSILVDSRADILVYGMGEYQVVEIARRLAQGQSLEGIFGTVTIAKEKPDNVAELPPEEDVLESHQALLRMYKEFYRNFSSRAIAQKSGTRYIIHNPPPKLKTEQLDAYYQLPFERTPHPLYLEKIPAYEMIKYSINAHRGCVGGCSFCSLTLHQGKQVVSRSADSITREIVTVSKRKVHISDIGGPSANMYGFSCAIGWCNRESCVFPSICKHLQLGNSRWLSLMDNALALPNVKKVSVGSGIRYDLFMQSKDAYKELSHLIKYFVSGQLKIAPEHTDATVLRAMRKVPGYSLEDFVKIFKDECIRQSREYYIVPYLMSCHPGSTNDSIYKVRNDIGRLFGYVPYQCQAFIPLPMTLSSIQYYTGSDPLTGEKFFVERNAVKRRKQHGILIKNIKN